MRAGMVPQSAARAKSRRTRPRQRIVRWIEYLVIRLRSSGVTSNLTHSLYRKYPVNGTVVLGCSNSCIGPLSLFPASWFCSVPPAAISSAPQSSGKLVALLVRRRAVPPNRTKEVHFRHLEGREAVVGV